MAKEKMLCVWRWSTELSQQSQMIGSEATLSNNSTVTRGPTPAPEVSKGLV